MPIILFGCKPTNIDDNIFNQTINSLNMNIFSKEGKKLFSIKSPYSTFDKDKNIFNLEDTTINIFRDNESLYLITSDKSILSNDNKLLFLNGNVLVKGSINQEDKLYSNSFTWNIQNSEYILLGNVKYETKSISLSSDKAILNNTNNIIEFFNPVKYKIKDINNESIYEVKSENAYYDIDTKSVSFGSKQKRVRSKIYF